jgi:hypothetical protein
MKDTVERAGDWASSISSIGKLLIAIFVFIFAVGTAWYQIETNASDNVRQDEQFKQIMTTITSQFDIMAQRSDKRYQRSMDEGDELHHEDDKIRDDLKEIREQNLELVKEIWYLKGKLGQ